MYITDVELTDLRSFAGTHALSLKHDDGGYAGWTVFAGRNGAGKSTLLKALALSVVGPLASRAVAGVFTDWVRRGSTHGTVATRLMFEDGRDGFQRGGRKSKTPFWAGLRWTAAAHGSDTLESWMEKETPTRRKVPERGPWADKPSGWFLVGYGPYRHLGAPPAEVLKLSRELTSARLVNLFNEAATLSDAVDWLKQLHLRDLEKRAGAGALKSSVLRVLADGLLPDGSTVVDVDSDGLWIERDGVRMVLEQVSDGYRTVAALVVDILRRLHETYGSLEIRYHDGHVVCDLPGVVLIDEVDAHLHVAWQQRIGFWLTRCFPRIQFLVTTHSPFICQAASPGGIIRLPAPGEGRRMEPVSAETWRAIVRGGADDAVMTELFGLEHAHSTETEALHEELATLEAKLISGRVSAAEKKRYATLRSELPNDLGALADLKFRALVGGQ